MLFKTISMTTERAVLSLRTGNTFIPVQAMPAYLLAPEVQGHYTAQPWCRRFKDDIRATNKTYRMHGMIHDPLYYLRNEEGFISFFLPSHPTHGRMLPYGVNYIEPHRNGTLYLAEIENFNKSAYKGIGKASVAQAIRYYIELHPNAQDTDMALSIFPRNNDQALAALYYDWGFNITLTEGPDKDLMLMSFKNACAFIDTYDLIAR